MSEEYPRRGRNWFTAMGVLFIVVGSIALLRQLILWSPDFVIQFLFNSEITSEKISIITISVGIVFVLIGFKKKYVQIR